MISNGFAYFSVLPPEIRLQIWSRALSDCAVWSAVYSPTHKRSFLSFVGPAPYLAGLASRESRRVLEQIYSKPVQGAKTGVCWINMEHTVISLGPTSNANAVMDSFPADDLARLKHVAFMWNSFGELARVCQRLATSCPALSTIIINQVKIKATPAASAPRPPALSVDVAKRFAAVLTPAIFELEYVGLDASYLRSLLLEYFDALPPKIHLLALECA
ncbi:MAG: hypothetical protein M1829_001974 [Trizodia sp. TS-e1964]|nr:MAG: hypothetical protein M1829_001974 [Trizodia sp. TS-e1964]